jgi:hypothetical protein
MKCISWMSTNDKNMHGVSDVKFEIIMHNQTARRSQWPRGLRSGSAALACWDCGFESRRGHGCLFFVDVACFQIKVSASG